MDWLETTERGNLLHREFTLRGRQRPVTGAFWEPAEPAQSRPLVCLGHGASGNRHQPPIHFLVRELVGRHGFCALAIDGPVHGRRQQGDGGRDAFWPEWRREGCVEDMITDWQLAIDAMQALPSVDGTVGYWGLSMGTIFGAPLVAADPRVKVAVLGLMGIAGPSHYRPAIEAAAQKITCPVLFIQQLEDELFDREQCLALFDALASRDKRLHANPGLHAQVPEEELQFSIEFLRRHLDPPQG